MQAKSRNWQELSAFGKVFKKYPLLSIATEGDLYVIVKVKVITTRAKSCCTATLIYSSQLCQTFCTSSSSSMVSMSFCIMTACSSFRG